MESKLVQSLKISSYRPSSNKSSSNGASWILVGLITVQLFLTAALYNSISSGLYNMAQLIIGCNILVFAAMLAVSRFVKNDSIKSKLLNSDRIYQDV